MAKEWNGLPDRIAPASLESASEQSSPQQGAEFEWPPLPQLPKPGYGSGTYTMYTHHQMQGYANAYGEAVRSALTQSPDSERIRGEALEEVAKMIEKMPLDAYASASFFRQRECNRQQIVEAIRARIAQPSQTPEKLDAGGRVLIDAAARSGDEGAIRLALQLAGAAPCEACGYVHYRCRCDVPVAARPSQEQTAEAISINILCESECDGIIGTAPLHVIRVEHEDDGSFTAITDYWPPAPSVTSKEPREGLTADEVIAALPKECTKIYGNFERGYNKALGHAAEKLRALLAAPPSQAKGTGRDESWLDAVHGEGGANNRRQAQVAVAHTTQAELDKMAEHNTGTIYRDPLDGDIPLYTKPLRDGIADVVVPTPDEKECVMINFTKIERGDNVDVMDLNEWRECVVGGAFIPSDGCGYWAKEDADGSVLESDIDCFAPQPEWATCVCWYNK